MTDETIRIELPSLRKKARAKKEEAIQPNADGVLIIPGIRVDKMHIPKSSEAAGVKIIPMLDFKKTKQAILANWKAYSPTGIVGIFRKHYQNKRTLSVMLSRFKKLLAKHGAPEPPPDNFLAGLKLKASEYKEIRTEAHQNRGRTALNSVVIPNADAIVMQALHYMYARQNPENPEIRRT